MNMVPVEATISNPYENEDTVIGNTKSTAGLKLDGITVLSVGREELDPLGVIALAGDICRIFLIRDYTTSDSGRF